MPVLSCRFYFFLKRSNEFARAVLKGGTVGTVLGLVGGVAGVMAASKRYHTIRSLTLPMKTFLVTSSGTFFGIVAADHASRSFEAEHNAQLKWYQSHEQQRLDAAQAQLSMSQRLMQWARQEKYKIVGATWVASMIGSFVLVGRNPYLTGQQKIVQARVYAQGLTLAVLVASAAFEISDQRRGRGILDAANKLSKERSKDAAPLQEKPVSAERHEQGDLWKDMVVAEENRLKSKHQSLYEHPELHKDQEPQSSDSAPKKESGEQTAKEG